MWAQLAGPNADKADAWTPAPFQAAGQDIVSQLLHGAGWRVTGARETRTTRSVLVQCLDPRGARVVVTAPRPEQAPVSKRPRASSDPPPVPSNVPDPVAQLEQLQAHQAKVSKPKSCCDHSDEEEEEDDVMAKIKQGKKQRKKEKMAEVSKEKGGGFFGEIKLLPLLFLFLLTASTALPAFFWILDNAGGVLVKTNLTGQLGYR